MDSKMVWNDLLERLRSAGLNPVEETYVDNYGNTLPLDKPEFHGRFFRCARGVIRCANLRLEVFLFPSETHLQDFLDVIGQDPRWVAHENALVHFPASDPTAPGPIIEAISDEN
jgi:hypothetical protein